MGGSTFSSSSSPSMVGIEQCSPLLCGCGVEAPLLMSRSGDNPGRRFYGCGLFKVYGRRMCKFFLWHDEENSRDRKLIGVLLKKIEEMKETQRLLVFSLVICIVLIFVLLISLVISIVKK